MSGRYAGIDLAAQARHTALAVLRETGGGSDADSADDDSIDADGPEHESRGDGAADADSSGGLLLERVVAGAEDSDLLALAPEVRKIGVDVPVGWPRPFVELLTAQAAGTLPAPASTGREWRRGLAMRATDLAVHERTGLTPLSVATDRIAHPALRWAGIEARLRDQGIDASRDGSGLICEVYPAAALRAWQLPSRGYKGVKNAAARRALVDALAAQLPALDWNGHQDLCAREDDALDAVLAALVAREVDQGRAVPPPPHLRELSRQEGWIWVPREVTPRDPGGAGRP